MLLQMPSKANLAEVPSRVTRAIVPGVYAANGARTGDVQRPDFIEFARIEIPLRLVAATRLLSVTPPAAEVVVGDAFTPVGMVHRDLSCHGVGIFIVLVASLVTVRFARRSLVFCVTQPRRSGDSP